MGLCVACGGSGCIEVEVVVIIPVCCNVPLPTGECCGDAVQGQELQQEQQHCSVCNGRGFTDGC